MATFLHLLQTMPNFNSRDPQVPSPLHCAVKRENLKMVRLLLQHGADRNPIYQKDQTPLKMAINQKNPEILRLLLESGARPQKLSYDAFNNAFGSNELSNVNREMVALLLDHHADLDLSHEEMIWLMCISVQALDVGIIRTVARRIRSLDCHAIFDYDDKNAEEHLNSPLCFAARLDDSEIASILIEEGASVEFRNGSYEKPLDIAVEFEVDDTVEILLLAGAKSDHSRYTYTEGYKLIVVKMQALGINVGHKLKKAERRFFREFKKECKWQVGLMKDMEISPNFGISVHDVMTKDLDQVARFLRNDELRREVDGVLARAVVEIPLYQKLLKFRIGVATARGHLFSCCRDVVYGILSQVAELPELCVLKVLENFTVGDMRLLVYYQRRGMI